MKTSGRSISWIIGIPIILAMGASGCATKKYVRSQVAPVNQRVADHEQKTSEQIQAVSTKEQADVSRLDERISTTDSRVVEVAGVAQQAGARANQAHQLGQANREEIQTHGQQIGALGTFSQTAWNYQMIEKGDVTFAVNQSRLDKQDKAMLDRIAQKAKSTPRTIIDLEGFADKTGGAAYNLTLSRKRADAVARYLVQQNVPLPSIHFLGFGEEKPHSPLAADFPGPGANASQKEMRRLSRRVYIRVYAPATAIGEAARSER
jgi:outer membrane protein OmpA-like peptidoglycan-associated protein